ncbi:RNA polymerase sigma factor [Streptomyces sp. NPDC001054]
MSTPAPRSGRRPGPVRPAAEDLVPPPLEEPLSVEDYDFEAFYLSQQEFFHAYAEIHLGTRTAAEELAHQAFLEIQGEWKRLVDERSVEQGALLIIRTLLARRLRDEGRDPAFVINGPVRQSLTALKERLALAESPHGLYAAAAALTGRQYDVFAMRHFLGFSTERIALFTNLAPRTVDYHLRRAKETVSRQLGLSIESRTKETP